MTDTVDVRTVGWNNPECCYQVAADEGYEDDEGEWHSDPQLRDELYCSIDTVNAKMDYCHRCDKYLVYP